MNVIDKNQLVLFRIWFLSVRDSFINLQRFTSSALLLDRSVIVIVYNFYSMFQMFAIIKYNPATTSSCVSMVKLSIQIMCNVSIYSLLLELAQDSKRKQITGLDIKSSSSLQPSL